MWWWDLEGEAKGEGGMKGEEGGGGDEALVRLAGWKVGD